MSDIFEQASRGKTRFAYKGQITVEDLWDLTAQELDAIFRYYNSKLKAEKEEGLLVPKNVMTSDLELKVSLIRRVVEVKLAEAKEKELSVENDAKKRRILDILARKQDDALINKSEDDLKRMLETL